MAAIELAAGVGDDFERILAHLDRYEGADARRRIREIIDAVDVLATNPHIGWPLAADSRELVIGRGARGHVALYRFVPELDTVFVLAIGSQREAG